MPCAGLGARSLKLFPPVCYQHCKDENCHGAHSIDEEPGHGETRYAVDPELNPDLF